MLLCEVTFRAERRFFKDESILWFNYFNLLKVPKMKTCKANIYSSLFILASPTQRILYYSKEFHLISVFTIMFHIFKKGRVFQPFRSRGVHSNSLEERETSDLKIC